tara:strand:- start:186 stop:323 length:138 start_codon:yes stop_codon:yes gene_type:complete
MINKQSPSRTTARSPLNAKVGKKRSSREKEKDASTQDKSNSSHSV